MKLQKAFFFSAVLWFALIPCFGQEKSVAVLHDEFGKICSEDLMSRYDGYMVRLYNEPSAMGYFVFYGEENFEGRNLNFIEYLKSIYPTRRGFDKTKLVLRRGANRPQMHIQFWVVPAGADAPKPVKEFVPEKIASTTLFDKNWADLYRDEYSKRREIYVNGFYDLGCEFSPNVKEFAEILFANPELTGYLVVYTKFGKGAKRGNQVAAFAVRDLVKNYKVPRARLKTIYGDNREEPEIELWLVPKGDKPPAPKPAKKQK